jgi:hypothetical protein
MGYRGDASVVGGDAPVNAVMHRLSGAMHRLSRRCIPYPGECIGYPGDAFLILAMHSLSWRCIGYPGGASVIGGDASVFVGDSEHRSANLANIRRYNGFNRRNNPTCPRTLHSVRGSFRQTADLSILSADLSDRRRIFPSVRESFRQTAELSILSADFSDGFRDDSFSPRTLHTFRGTIHSLRGLSYFSRDDSFSSWVFRSIEGLCLRTPEHRRSSAGRCILSADFPFSRGSFHSKGGFCLSSAELSVLSADFPN